MEQLSQIISAVFIFLGLFLLSRQAKDITNEKTFLLVFLTYVLASMVLLFIADKIFFPNRQLISKEVGVGLFGLIKELLYILFGYYFAKTQTNEN